MYLDSAQKDLLSRAAAAFFVRRYNNSLRRSAKILFWYRWLGVSGTLGCLCLAWRLSFAPWAMAGMMWILAIGEYKARRALVNPPGEKRFGKLVRKLRRALPILEADERIVWEDLLQAVVDENEPMIKVALSQALCLPNLAEWRFLYHIRVAYANHR